MIYCRCIKLLQTYVLGSKQIDFQFLSNQAINFPSSLKSAVNYENENMNISIPIFTIHGNHDDVINNTSALDVLSSTGLINYFGQWKDLEKIQVSPIILQKNTSKIALYGLNHIPDRRLNNLMTNQAFKIAIPEVIDDTFCMFVLHQNRADRGARNYIMESMLPAFLNLVIWGHEHDCRIEPEATKNTFIVQPGSSVATSLSQGESIEKKVGILEIRGKEFKLTPIALRTVRPFIFRSIDIKDYEEEIMTVKGEMRDKVTKVLDGVVKEMIEEAKGRISGHARQPKFPLLRLRVSYDDNQYLINPKRFGQSYASLIANSDDLLLYKRNIKRTKAANNDPDNEVLNAAIQHREKQDRVEDVVESYFKQLTDEKDKLKLLNLESLSEACRILVERDDEQGATELLSVQVEAACAFLNSNNVAEDQQKAALKQFNEQESKEAFDEGLRIILARKHEDTAKQDNNDSGDNHDDDDDDGGPPTKKATRGRGRGKGGAAGSTRGKKTSPTDNSANTSTRGARGARGKQAPKDSIAQQLSLRRRKPYLSDSSDDN